MLHQDQFLKNVEKYKEYLQIISENFADLKYLELYVFGLMKDQEIPSFFKKLFEAFAPKEYL